MAYEHAWPGDFLCYGCGATARASDRGMTCGACGEPFAVRSLAKPPSELFSRPARNMWDYAPLLPVDRPDAALTLGEGATPLVEAPALARRLGCGRVLLKNEMSNPTGSFKDRQVAVGITHARELGYDTVAVVSSGNVACAAAAYAARAGMRAVLFMHGHAASGKVAQAMAYGARAIQVDVPSASAVFDLCIEACAQFGWYHLSTAGLYEPYNVEGAKTIAYELFQQTGGQLPEWVIAPVGGGGLLGGIWRGFLDLERLGIIERPPLLAGVQAAGCAPLPRAIREGQTFLQTLDEPWLEPKTIAGGIADDILFDGHTVLPAIRTTGGAALAVDDEAILDGLFELARTEGLLCEPTCATVIAGAHDLPGVTEGSTVCCVLTGSGLKDLDALRPRVGPPERVACSIEAVRELVGECV